MGAPNPIVLGQPNSFGVSVSTDCSNATVAIQSSGATSVTWSDPTNISYDSTAGTLSFNSTPTSSFSGGSGDVTVTITNPDETPFQVVYTSVAYQTSTQPLE